MTLNPNNKNLQLACPCPLKPKTWLLTTSKIQRWFSKVEMSSADFVGGKRLDIAEDQPLKHWRVWIDNRILKETKQPLQGLQIP